MGVGQGRPAPVRRTGVGPGKPVGNGATTGTSNPITGATSPYSPAPTPWNSAAEQIVAGARRNYLNSQSNFDLAEQEAKADYGLDQGFNDYKANPYSRAALLEQSYRDANRGTVNTSGLRLYSGSTSNALAGNRSTRDLSYNNLANTYREALGEITKGRTEAAERRAEEEREAEWKRIMAAEESEPDAEAAPPGPANAKKKPKSSKKKGGPAVGPGKKAK